MELTIPIKVELDEKHLGNAIDKYMRENPDVVEVVRCKDCKHLTVINSRSVYARCEKTGYVFKNIKKKEGEVEGMREDKKEKRKGRGEREEKGRERGMEEGREGWRKGSCITNKLLL